MHKANNKTTHAGLINPLEGGAIDPQRLHLQTAVVFWEEETLQENQDRVSLRLLPMQHQHPHPKENIVPPEPAASHDLGRPVAQPCLLPPRTPQKREGRSHGVEPRSKKRHMQKVKTNNYIPAKQANPGPSDYTPSKERRKAVSMRPKTATHRNCTVWDRQTS